MKKILLIILIITGIASSTKAQTDSIAKAHADSIALTKKRGTVVNFTATIKNQHYWRGYAVGPSPMMTALVSISGKKSGLEIGTWNGFAFDGGFKDCDLYAQWSKKGFTLALWDVFNYSDYSVDPAMAGYGDHGTADYFNYNSGETRHFFDLSVGYDIPKTKLNLFLATIIAGRDWNADGSNIYSTYAKASYNLKSKNDVSITPYVSYSFALNYKGGSTGYTFYDWTPKSQGKSSGFSEIGVNFSKSIKISDKYSVTPFAGVVASPLNQTMTGLFGITLF
jgi:hypothetical protein